MKDEMIDPLDSNIEITIAFLREFPVGSTLHPDQFDRWAWRAGYLPEPKSLKKRSDAWKAQLQRRQELKAAIRRTATSDAYLEMGGAPFAIIFERSETWVVRTTQDAITGNRVAAKVKSLFETGDRMLKRWQRTLDDTQLSPMTRFQIEQIEQHLANFREMLDLQVGQYQRQINQMETAQRRLFTPGDNTVKVLSEKTSNSSEYTH